MRRAVPFLVLVAVLAAGCPAPGVAPKRAAVTPKAKGSPAAPKVKAAVSLKEAVTNIARQTYLARSGNLVGTNSSGVISNNGGGVISNNGGGAVAPRAYALGTETHDIAVEAAAGETLVRLRRWVDGSEDRMFIPDLASNRTVELNPQGRAIGETHELLGPRPDGAAGTFFERTEVLLDDAGDVLRYFKNTFLRREDRTAEKLTFSPQSLVRLPGTDTRILIQQLEAEASGQAKFKIRYEPLGWTDAGELNYLRLDQTLYFTDPLLLADGTSTVSGPDGAIIFRKRQVRTFSGADNKIVVKSNRTYEVPDGPVLTFESDYGSGEWEGIWYLPGSAQGSARMTFDRSNGAVVVRLEGGMLPAPLVAGFGPAGAISEAAGVAPDAVPTPPSILPGWHVTTSAGALEPGHRDAESGRDGRLKGPTGVAWGSAGLAVADTLNHRIRLLEDGGRLRTLAGSGERGGADGPAAAASFDLPVGVAYAPDGALVVVEEAGRIRRIAPDGTVSTLAGSAEEGFRDGPGRDARFTKPAGLAVAADGRIFVADFGNHRIRLLDPRDPAHPVTTIAGTGTQGATDGPGAAAAFAGPGGLAVRGGDKLVVADVGNHRLREIDLATSAYAVRTLAGTAEPGYVDGPAASAVLGSPFCLAADAAGNVFFADAAYNVVRQLGADGQVRTIAGTPERDAVSGLSRPAMDGFMKHAILSRPLGLACLPDGRALAICDVQSNMIRLALRLP